MGRVSGRWIAAVVAAVALGTAGRAEAISITLTAASSPRWVAEWGTPLGDETALLAVVQAAADTWSAALGDSREFNIEVGFTNRLFGGADAAEERINFNDPTSTMIAFAIDESWFIDPTPFDNSEYASESLTSADLGGGVINTGHQYLGGSGAAASSYDLFSIALHEMGHNMGLDSEYGGAHGDAAIVVTDPRPDAGSVIPQSFGHLSLSTAVMAPDASTGLGMRTLLSDADILAIAEAGNYTDVHLNDFNEVPQPEPVPEPPSFFLVCSALGVLLASRWRRDCASPNR